MNGDAIKVLRELEDVAQGYLDEQKSSWLMWSKFSGEVMLILNRTERAFHKQAQGKESVEGPKYE